MSGEVDAFRNDWHVISVPVLRMELFQMTYIEFDSPAKRPGQYPVMKTTVLAMGQGQE